MKRRLRQYDIYKLTTNRLIDGKGKDMRVIPLSLTKREALENGEIVKIQENQLTNTVFRWLEEHGMSYNANNPDVIVNVEVPSTDGKIGEQVFSKIAKEGFTLNGKHYVRFASGSGQIRRNTVTFIREDLYQPINHLLMCGLTPEDFGDDFNAAKYNAYFGLNMSGCHLLPDDIAPNVCIIDDYEAIRPHVKINHVTEREVDFITLPTEDYVLTEDQADYLIENGKAIRKSDGEVFTIRHGIKKYIRETYYDEIPDAPALNSFDGQGLASPEWMERASLYLGLDYIPSCAIVRAPWIKGLLCTVPFHEWFSEVGITNITDAFGNVRNVMDIDCFISKSQFKMAKIYQRKCRVMGVDTWDYYRGCMQRNHLHWGIVKTSARIDDNVKTLNYQYLQPLQLSDSEIDALCKPTEDYLTSLNSGDIQAIYDNLMVNAGRFAVELPDDVNIVLEYDEKEKDANYKKLFQKVIEANRDFVNDAYIRKLILQECQTKFDGAKLGKIFVCGNYQFCISDPIAQLQWITQHHGGVDIDVTGVIPSGFVYSDYWLNTDETPNEIVIFRSPCIDRNEICKRQLVKERAHYLRYLSSGIVFPIHDLDLLALGGADFDGDIVMSTDNPIIRRGCYTMEQQRPLYYQLSATSIIGTITLDNLISADVRGLNSKVGQISNKAGSLYAKMEHYGAGTPEYQSLYNSIVALGQVVGMEIDRIKTAIMPTLPLEWKPIQIIKQTVKTENGTFADVSAMGAAETSGCLRHNDLCPDVKPYFFRYNYAYLDDAIKQRKREFDKFCRLTMDCRLEDVMQRYTEGTANDEEKRVAEQYRTAYPVIETDCVVNHICKNFEEFERKLKRETTSEGVNMLAEYVTGEALDRALLDKVKFAVAGYLRQRRLLAKAMKQKANCTNKGKCKSVYDLMSLVGVHYRNAILDLFDGNVQRALDYLTEATDEETIWRIFDTALLPLVRKG